MFGGLWLRLMRGASGDPPRHGVPSAGLLSTMGVAMGPVIDMHDVVVLLDRFPALAGVTARVDQGEVVLLRGANGVGKTTFLRACAGLLSISAGRAEVLGHDLAQSRRGVRRHVAMLGHDTQLYDDLTVLDNVRFWSRAGGSTGEVAVDALERMDVPARIMDVQVERLSAGQRRRVAIAVVIARRPRLWLLDEPHAGLDQSGRDLLDALLLEAAAAGGTVVFASHELDRAMAVAHRALVFQGGRVAKQEHDGHG